MADIINIVAVHGDDQALIRIREDAEIALLHKAIQTSMQRQLPGVGGF